jgi:hypothetical protein
VFAPTPVAPTSLARVHGRSRAERTVRALLDTVTDIRRQFIGDALSAGLPTTPGSATGGLRGGRAVYKGSGIAFRRVACVPGVLVSGFEPFTRGVTARYTLAGAAAHGTVAVLGDGRIVGRLDGRQVAYRVSSVRAARAGGAAAWQPRLPRLPRLARVR